jgi:hypothetical protein
MVVDKPKSTRSEEPTLLCNQVKSGAEFACASLRGQSLAALFVKLGGEFARAFQFAFLNLFGNVPRMHGDDIGGFRRRDRLRVGGLLSFPGD